MNDTAAIAALTALAHERRLSVFQLLAGYGPQGLSAGGIAEALDVPPSSLSFHLNQLEQAGLISSRRAKRQIFYAVVTERLAELVGYLVGEGKKADAGFGTDLADRIGAVS